MNKVSVTARSNQYLDAIKMPFPTAHEFYINQSHSSSCKNKNREGYGGRVRMTPSCIPCACGFSVHEGMCYPVKKG